MKEKNANNTGLMLVVAFALLVSSFLYLQFIIPYHIFFKEQIQLFVYDSNYLLSYFSKPGELACLTGDFFTQFLYLKGGGAVVISLLFFFEWLLIVRLLNSFGVKQLASLWALLPVIAEWMIIGAINYSIAMSVAFALVLLIIYLYIHIQNKVISVGLGILFIPILYLFIGGAMFLFLAVVLLYEIHKEKKRYVYWLTLIALAVIIPYLLRIHYLITVKQAYFYPMQGIKQVGSSILVVLILFFASFKSIRKWRVTAFSFSLAVLFILVFGIVGLKLSTNLQREKILGMATEADFENWNKVLKMAEKSEIKNPIATYYTNLALSKQMQLGDRMMEFYQPFTSGLFLPVNPKSNWFITFFSSDVYYHIGDMNMAQHSAMLGMTFSPYQRSARLVQRLIEINLVSEDIPAAMKYIRMLESSLFHREKAVQLKEMALTTNPDNYPWLQNKRKQIHTSDILLSSRIPQTTLELLVKTNPDNREALDYLLAYHLMNKNIQGFFNVYSTYCKGKTNYLPKVYAEALLIYFASSKTQPEEISKYNVNPLIINDFTEYTQLYESTKGNLELLQEKFPHTYWLFYHFATIKT